MSTVHHPKDMIFSLTSLLSLVSKTPLASEQSFVFNGLNANTCLDCDLKSPLAEFGNIGIIST